jgi:MFS family permease
MIRLCALMVAFLAQAQMGLLSDRSTHPWGRRRPFILAGTLSQVVVLVLIGFSASLVGMTGYWVLFGLYILSMIASDSAHAATQGLIPDLVPEEKRGQFSGVKALLELPLPLIFVSFVIAQLISMGNMWAALIAVMAVLLICMAFTMFVREQPLTEAPFEFDWKPILRLVLMTAAFTAIILGAGEIVKLTIRMTESMSQDVARLLLGLAGLVGMIAAILIGVWVSVRISVGQEARENPPFTWWVIMRLAFLVPATNLAGFVLFFLQERFPELQGERAAGPAGFVVMFVGVLILLTALPAGWLADRIGRKPLILISSLLAAVGTLVVVVAPGMTVIYVGACFIGAAAGLFYSANWALGTDLVPQEQAGRYLGLSNLAGAGAGAIGAYLGGPIADNVGYVPLFAIYGCIFLLSALPLLRIPETRGQALSTGG